MSLDTSTMQVGERPLDKSVHIVRISSVRCALSYNKNSLRLAMGGVIAEGPSSGYQIDFPALNTLLADRAGKYTAQWITNTRKYLGQILGRNANDIHGLPTRAGEITPLMQDLLNLYVECEIQYVPPKIDDATGQEFRERFEVRRVLRPVESGEVMPVEWSEYFDFSDPFAIAESE